LGGGASGRRADAGQCPIGTGGLPDPRSHWGAGGPPRDPTHQQSVGAGGRVRDVKRKAVVGRFDGTPADGPVLGSSPGPRHRDRRGPCLVGAGTICESVGVDLPLLTLASPY